MRAPSLLVPLLVPLVADGGAARPAPEDPLPSWRAGPVKEALLDFVERVSDPRHVEFVTVEERVAVFDNDGTLWCEKPLYTQVAFMVDRARFLIDGRPELASEEPFATLLEDPVRLLADQRALLELVGRTHTGMTQREFVERVERWFGFARHPRFERPYDTLVYQPMLELLALLERHGFQTWISTGGGLDFVRCFARELYGVPPERVIGSTIVKNYQRVDGRTFFVREAELVPPINDGPGKPVNVQRRIGRVPILAVGNSDGDLELLEHVDDRHGATLAVLVHHDDAEREYDYDAGTERALAAAEARGWTVASIGRDFARVFPAFEVDAPAAEARR